MQGNTTTQLLKIVFLVQQVALNALQLQSAVLVIQVTSCSLIQLAHQLHVNQHALQEHMEFLEIPQPVNIVTLHVDQLAVAQPIHHVFHVLQDSTLLQQQQSTSSILELQLEQSSHKHLMQDLVDLALLLLDLLDNTVSLAHPIATLAARIFAQLAQQITSFQMELVSLIAL